METVKEYKGYHLDLCEVPTIQYLWDHSEFAGVCDSTRSKALDRFIKWLGTIKIDLNTWEHPRVKGFEYEARNVTFVRGEGSEYLDMNAEIWVQEATQPGVEYVTKVVDGEIYRREIQIPAVCGPWTRLCGEYCAVWGGREWRNRGDLPYTALRRLFVHAKSIQVWVGKAD